jgi:hypothetical protein
MDDIRVGSVVSYDTYGERQRAGSGKRRKNFKADSDAESETAAADFFEASAADQNREEVFRDYFAPTDRTTEEP